MDRTLLVLAMFCLTAVHPLDAHTDSAPRTNLIQVWNKQEGDSFNFYVRNQQLADVTVTFEVELTNVRSSTEFPHTVTFAAGQTGLAFSFAYDDPSQPVNWAYTYYASYGNLEAVHDDSYVYALPYAPGKSYRVSQGYDGSYSHFGSNRYAVDFRMPVGTPIHAAREGIVVAARDDSNRGGADRKFEADANFIIIQHPDRTMAHYVHLAHRGNAVKPGDRVRRGQFIALSGNTGFSTGPHLHFAVFKAQNGRQRETIPVTYRTTLTAAELLVEGRSYRAPSVASQSIQVAVERAPRTGESAGSPE